MNEVAPGIVVQDQAAPARFMADVCDGWHGRPYAGRMVSVDLGENYLTGEAMGTEMVAVNSDRHGAYLFGREARAAFDAGHYLRQMDSGVMMAFVPRDPQCCGCTGCRSNQ